MPSSFLSWLCWCPACKADTSKVLDAEASVKSSSPMLADGLFAGSTAPTLRAFNHLPQSVGLEKHPTVPMYSPVM
jgi:hypothetical protein